MSDHDSTGAAAGKATVGGGLTLLLVLKMLSGCTAPVRNAFKLGGTAVRSVAGAARGAIALDVASGVGGVGRAAEEAYGAGGVLRGGAGAARNALNELRVVVPENPSGLGHASQEFASGAAGAGENGSFVKKGLDLTRGRPRVDAATVARLFEQERLHSQLLLLHSAEQPAANTKVLSFIPTSEDAFQNVFKIPLSSSRRLEMLKYSRLFKGLPNSRVVTSAEYDSKALLSYIRENPGSNPLIITGHSEEINAGRSLILPNGERVSVDLIHQQCLAVGSKCLVLTCHSDDFRLGSRISLKDAYYMTRRGIEIKSLAESRPILLPRQVRAALADGSVTSTDMLVEAMRSERAIRKAGKVTIWGATSTGAAGGAGTYVIRQKRNRR